MFILNAIASAITGYCYGLLFVAGKQRALSHERTKIKQLLFMSFLTLLRFAFLAGFLIYLLRLDFLGSILTLASFLLSFWLSITRKGLMHHEGRKS